jgi:hypothetical protein
MRLPSLLSADMDATLEASVDATLQASRMRVPMYVQAGLIDYLRFGIPPGSFVQAVLANDLCAAVMRADEESRAKLWDIVAVLITVAPRDAWGSPAKVTAWIEKGAALRRAALTP